MTGLQTQRPKCDDVDATVDDDVQVPTMAINVFVSTSYLVYMRSWLQGRCLWTGHRGGLMLTT
eukprot:6184375-Pleurochrysis_carterae.AAC.2